MLVIADDLTGAADSAAPAAALGLRTAVFLHSPGKDEYAGDGGDADVISIDANDNLVVVFTPRGFSAALAEAIDESNHPMILATIAGDNTILVVPATGVRPAALRDELHAHILEGVA